MHIINTHLLHVLYIAIKLKFIELTYILTSQLATGWRLYNKEPKSVLVAD